MPEKYFATIMKKINLGNGDYVYTADYVVAGNIDKKTRVLTTTIGDKYKRIDDFSDYENTSAYYSNHVEVNKITDVFNGAYTFSDAVKEYEKNCKQINYYVCKVKKDGYVIIPIDKRPFVKAIDKIDENPEKYENNRQPITNNSQEKQELDEDQYIEEIKNLVIKVLENKFSLNELTDIKYRLIDQKEELEAAIESVQLKLDVLELENSNSTTSLTDIRLPKKHSVTDAINVDNIFDKVTKVLVAQDKPARRAIVELSRLDRMRKKDYGILLTGESGVGKTLLMSLLARNINRPFLSIDSTQLTAQGYAGKSIEEYLWELYEDCDKDVKKAERAIVFFDEIDKKGSEKKSDISGQAVLNMLLKFLDGTTYTACKNPQQQTTDTMVKIDTSNMIIVAGGAFLDVYNAKKEKHIGFSSEEQSSEKDKTDEPKITDFIKKSMMTKEFMGRVPVIIHLNNLDVDGIRRILLDSKDSALKIQEEVFAECGVKLTTKDGYIISVAQKALDEKIGARGLNKFITDTTWVAYDKVASNPGVYEEVILTEETVENEETFQLVKRNLTNKKSS